jgi:hypothetical protein
LKKTSLENRAEREVSDESCLNVSQDILEVSSTTEGKEEHPASLVYSQSQTHSTQRPREHKEVGVQALEVQVDPTAEKAQVFQEVRCSHETSENQAPALPTHMLTVSFLQEIAILFGDRSPKGTRTRVLSQIKEASLETPVEVLTCLIRAYTVARDTRTIRPEHRCSKTGKANRMPLFCTMFQRFVEERKLGIWWGFSWQQVEEEIAADDYLAHWWQKHQDLAGMPGHAPGEEETEAQIQPDALSEKEAPVMEQPSSRSPSRHRRLKLSQTDEEREERQVRARQVLRSLSMMAIPLQGAIILWEHVMCGSPVYHQRGGKEMCALCFPDPNWPEEAFTLLRSIVEEKSATDAALEVTKEALLQIPVAAEANQEKESRLLWEEAAGWVEREEAYVHGMRLINELAHYGYVVEVYLHLRGDHYQVIVRGADGELACETAEQVKYLIEQAQNGLL